MTPKQKRLVQPEPSIDDEAAGLLDPDFDRTDDDVARVVVDSIPTPRTRED